jgi:hypothetical protein
MNHRRKLWAAVFFVNMTISFVTTSCAQAIDLSAELDRSNATLPINQSTVLSATLHNGGTAPIYITGIQVTMSENASGDIYNPTRLHEELHSLNAGQTWDGPLIMITPKHRGPLTVTGSIFLKGGLSVDSSGVLLSIPLTLMIDDPRRNADGSFERGTKPLCDRSSDPCCDPAEVSCVQRAGHCFYLADGFDREQVCVDHQAGKTYEHIADLQVSSDATHLAYIASFHCSSAEDSEFCQRVIVLDQTEQTGPQVPTQLILSSDGKHTAYIARENCLTHLGVEMCTGPSRVIVDGQSSSKREAVQGLSFSPDGLHWAYEMGKECRRSDGVSPPLKCRESMAVVDEQPVHTFPSWYIAAPRKSVFIRS